MPTRWSSRKRWLFAASYLAFWTIYALLNAAETYHMQQKFDKPISWALALRRSAEEIYTYGFIALLVFWCCKRLPFQPERARRWVLTHIGLCAAFSLFAVSIVTWLWTGQISVQTGKPLEFPSLFHKLVFTCTISNIFKYWVLVFGYLGWQYYCAYREREHQAAALATELVQARLQALRMQLNPHFLFNTLNTVLALIHEKPQAADRMLVRLSQLLRRTLDQGQAHEVPLREEIEFLKMYLEIEQVRFADRLHVTYDIAPRTEDLLVPQLILQPLVENALRHGILPREQAGRIEISARVSGGRLELRVRDDGNGLPGRLDSPGREGVGLKNVRSRLEHLYGAAHRLDLRNAADGGVEALVSLPARSGPASNALRVLAGPAAEPEADVAGVSAAVSANANS